MLSRIAAAAVIGGLLWHPLRPGMWVSESQMAADGPLSVVRSIAIRVDPARYRFQLDTATRDYGIRGAWTVASLPGDGVVAFNAGQFNAGFPWGWVVRDGVELQPPGSGKLAMAFTVDRDGRADIDQSVDIGPIDLVEKHAGIGGERFHIAPLAFGEQGVERERGFSRP